MTTVDDTISKLDALLDRSDNPPTVTAEVTYRRDGLIFQQGDVAVFGVSCDVGSARGLLWVEDRFVSDEHHEVIDASTFRQRWPMHDRRHMTATSAAVAQSWPHLDRRAS